MLVADDPWDAEEVLVAEEPDQLLLRVDVVPPQLLLVEVQVFERLLVLLVVAALGVLVQPLPEPLEILEVF